MDSDWSAIRLQRYGAWNFELTKLFPETTALITELAIPTAIRGVCFAKQAPQRGVGVHSDDRNFILTAHLGIDVPATGCSMTVGGWEDGKLVVCDTSFDHYTSNDSPDALYVLIIDFFHSELTQRECEQLRFIYQKRNEFENLSAEVKIESFFDKLFRGNQENKS